MTVFGRINPFKLSPLQALEKPIVGDVLQLRNPLRGELTKVLVRRLDDRDSKVRFQAAAALGEAGSKSEKAIPKLIQRLGDPVMKVRFFAAQSLGNIGLEPERVAPELMRLIAREKEYSDSNPSYAAFRSLIKLGVSYPHIIIPLLVSELSSDSDFVRSGIENSLIKIGERERLLLYRYLDRAIRAQNKKLSDQAKELSEKMAEILPDEFGALAGLS